MKWQHLHVLTSAEALKCCHFNAIARTASQLLNQTALLRSEYHLPGTSAEMRALDAIVQRCLAKDPRDRYGSASELASELVPALARCEGISAPQPIAGADGSMVITRDL